MSSVLVTGAGGQDGSYLVERLAAEGHRVHAVVRPGGRLHPSADGLSAVRTRQVDLADREALRELVASTEPAEIYHLAGLSSVAAAWRDPEATGVLTGLAPVTLMDAALRLQERTGRAVRFVQASSAEIFGVPDRAPQDESTPVRPANPYGAAKAYAHHMAGAYRRLGLHVASCVLFNHESPRRPPAFVTRKITRAAARIATGRQSELALGNLDARRDWGWAPDYVDAMVRAARHDEPVDVVVATGETHSVADLAAAAFAAAGLADWRRHVRVDEGLLRPSDAPLLVGDAGRAHAVLGWAPTRGFAEIVAAMVEHDLAHPGDDAA